MNADLPRLALTRAEAALVCGVGVDTISAAKNTGALKAKKTGRDKNGNGTGKELYTVAALQSWLDSLVDA